MNDDLKPLQRSYRDIKAPRHIATRVRATVEDRPHRATRWLPVSATATAIVVAVWLLPVLMQPTTEVNARPPKPSLSALASLKPEKPAIDAPSLSKLRSVSVPAMPRKPKSDTRKPQSSYQPEYHILKEKPHAHS